MNDFPKVTQLVSDGPGINPPASKASLFHSIQKTSSRVMAQTLRGQPKERSPKKDRMWLQPHDLDQQICSGLGRRKEKRTTVTSLLGFSHQPSQHHGCSRVIF